MDFLIKPNQLFLAPMSGITDKSFRLLMRELGADVVISELLSSESIANSHSKTLKMLKVLESERPVGIQLFGGDPLAMNKAAKIAIDQGADFIDINLGCPMPKVVKKRSGSALLIDPIYLLEFLSRINVGLSKPMTVKMRIGWDSNSKNAKQNIEAAQKAGAVLVSVHGRTREQGYEGKSDWEFIKSLKPICQIPLVGNGDIIHQSQANYLIENNFADSLMIGRGCLFNPLLFLQIKQQNNSEESQITLPEIIERYIEITEKHVDSGYRNIKRAKIFHWFSLNFEDTDTFKNKIFDLKTEPQSLIQFTREYFKNKLTIPQRPFGIKDFLMGGHG